MEGSFTAIPDIVERILNQDCEKQILIEVESVADAEAVMGLPIHGLQYDKFEPALLNTLVAKVRANNPKLIQLAAGGINLSNAADYAATGVDGLVTTSTYFVKPADVGVRFYKL